MKQLEKIFQLILFYKLHHKKYKAQSSSPSYIKHYVTIVFYVAWGFQSTNNIALPVSLEMGDKFDAISVVCQKVYKIGTDYKQISAVL